MLAVIRAFVCGILPFLTGPALANALPFAGDPPVTRLVPQLDVYPQNFALAQTPDGLLYVGNAEGVLVFNGEQWSITPLPNGDLVRSLAVDDNGRVYVGGYNQFGFLERDESGREHFHDLAQKFSSLLNGEQFADIWSVLPTRHGVFFRGVQHLFLYEPESGDTFLWRREARYGAIAQAGDDVIVQFRGEGLRRFTGDGWAAVPGTQSLRELAYQFVNLHDGGILMLSTDGEWRRFGDNGISAFVVPPGFPPSSEFTRGLAMRDGQIALTTSDGALVMLDPVQGAARRFELTTGFIPALIPSLNGGIFMLSAEAVLHINWPAAWTVVGQEYGLAGRVHHLAQWRSRWFVMTNSGAQELLPPPRADDGMFRNLDWTGNEAWHLLALDEETALLAESYALLLVDSDGTVRPVTHGTFYPRVLQRSEYDSDIIFIGTEMGFAVLRNGADKPEILLEVDDIDAPGIRSIVQVSPRELWFGSERGGVLRARLSPELDALESLKAYHADAGIAYGPVPAAVVTRAGDGSVLASTHRGLFVWNGERFVADPQDGLAGLRGKNELLFFAAAPDGERWAHSFHRIFRNDGRSGWREQDVGNRLNGAIENVAFDAGGAPLFGTTSSILRFDEAAAGEPARGLNVGLRSVMRLNPDGTTIALPLRTPEPLLFDNNEMNIVFRFSLPDFTQEKAARYSARLSGLETQWSDWSRSSGFTYYRMRPGTYALELRARDSHGRVTAIEPWRFRVVPAWYARPLATVAWMLLGVILLLFLMHEFSRRRTSRLAVEKTRLEDMVAERTRELEAANRKLDAIAHVDGLTEIPNRRRLDEYLAHVWRQCAERQRSLAVLVIDVDHFKRYNDRYGHLAGDHLLRTLASVLSRGLRRSEDLVARYGGEEFLIVLPGADLSTARSLAEQIRETVEMSSLGASISIGLAASTPGTGDSVTRLIGRADAALYAAKADGRNCVRDKA
ncbi:MAG TPA: diguanylate cyclase [Gammaproteobacteria bacterium]